MMELLRNFVVLSRPSWRRSRRGDNVNRRIRIGRRKHCKADARG